MIKVLLIALLSLNTNAEKRLADREYIASMLMAVFGPTAEPVVRKNILSRIDLFGGPCDPNEEVKISRTDKWGNEEVVNAGSPIGCPRRLVDGRASYIPKDTIVRKMAIFSTCAILLENEKAFRSALSVSENQKLPPFDETNKKMIYGKFYRFEEPKFDLAQDLKHTPRLRDKWLKYTLAVCASPGWQTL